MNRQKTVVLLIGSPRGRKSTSFSLGNYLCQKLEEEWTVKYGYIQQLVMREEKHLELITLMNTADIIIFSFPLYVDQLPSTAIRAFEVLYKNRTEISNRKQKIFLPIGNCGFPEASQIDLALEICHNFANAMNFQWRGGIKLGGGEAIHGICLEERGGMVRNQIKGLDGAAEALLRDDAIPQEVIDLIAREIIPKGLYKGMGNMGWRIRALKHWNMFNLKKKPYKK
ncbi:MAG: hypothetical protein BAJALOKI1v1_1410002 [Promethearchaeota archaeon]|nr:MAG: hypothetical protein BAJALOKI1v1_1410002 [Candidatus Lokiarchaeota archaeon]